jgi:hypothetical protein
LKDPRLPDLVDLPQILDDFVVDEDFIAQAPSPALRGL